MSPTSRKTEKSARLMVTTILHGVSSRLVSIFKCGDKFYAPSHWGGSIEGSVEKFSAPLGDYRILQMVEVVA